MGTNGDGADEKMQIEDDLILPVRCGAGAALADVGNAALKGRRYKGRKSAARWDHGKIERGQRARAYANLAAIFGARANGAGFEKKYAADGAGSTRNRRLILPKYFR